MGGTARGPQWRKSGRTPQCWPRAGAASGPQKGSRRDGSSFEGLSAEFVAVDIASQRLSAGRRRVREEWQRRQASNLGHRQGGNRGRAAHRARCLLSVQLAACRPTHNPRVTDAPALIRRDDIVGARFGAKLGV